MFPVLSAYYSQGAQPLLLDLPELSGVPVGAAYSLRKLREVYSGSAIRVRRSSDNTEQDIGFVDNALDTAALLSFCGGGSGYAASWYEQTANGRTASSTVSANQPRGVNSGALETVNSLAALRWLSSQLDLAAGFAHVLPITIYAVVDTTLLDTGYKLLLERVPNGPNIPGPYLGVSGGNYKPGCFWSALKAVWGASVQRHAVVRWRFSSTATGVRVDDAAEVTETNGSGLTEWTSIGLASAQTLNNTPLQELIIIHGHTVASVEDAAIMDNINAYYGVY